MKIFIAVNYTDLIHLGIEGLQACDVVLFMEHGWITIIKNRWGSCAPFPVEQLGTFLYELASRWNE